MDGFSKKEIIHYGNKTFQKYSSIVKSKKDATENGIQIICNYNNDENGEEIKTIVF